MDTNSTVRVVWGKGELRRDLRARLKSILGMEVEDHRILAEAKGRKRLYTTGRQRQVQTAHVVHALVQYARGESARSVAKKFAAAGLLGLSAHTIESYAKLVCQMEGKTKVELLVLLEPSDGLEQKLTRVLVDVLDATAGKSSELPVSLQWRRWDLTEVVFFVRTGSWPPRVLCQVLSSEEGEPWAEATHKDWRFVTRQLMQQIAERSPQALINREIWADVQARAHAMGLPFSSQPPLKPGAPTPTVRNALTRSPRPQEWRALPSTRELRRVRAPAGGWCNVPDKSASYAEFGGACQGFTSAF